MAKKSVVGFFRHYNLCSLHDFKSLNNLNGLNDLDSLISSKKITDPDGWIIPGTKMTNNGPFLWIGSSKIHCFTNV